MEQIKRAIILAAGEGKRLRPVTLSTPKPLIKVNGTRFIDYIIGALKSNGIHEIYIVTGYKKEQFIETYKEDSDITIIENPYYLDGNNITSIYVARDYLEDTFIIEGDQIINNTDIFKSEIDKSGYAATYMDHAPEWAINVEQGRITNFSIDEGDRCHRLFGISMWNAEDGKRLRELVRAQFEDIKDLDVYWDELALSRCNSDFDLGIREVGPKDIIEVDTLDELIEIDSSYAQYKTGY
ncbi:MAG: phosphocholine cytidylyltransferase family protein [Lachnospiraceae bacterium]|nr:phosphocholine cytidylyltransferase family protein [Lachnospiraceae bacterium]